MRDAVDKKCGEGCRAQLLEHFAFHDIEVTATLTPPIIDTGYEPLDMRCPHGRLWYAEPTGEQRAKWAKEGTP